jgi:hypothetical protein
MVTYAQEQNWHLKIKLSTQNMQLQKPNNRRATSNTFQTVEHTHKLPNNIIWLVISISPQSKIIYQATFKDFFGLKK